VEKESERFRENQRDGSMGSTLLDNAGFWAMNQGKWMVSRSYKRQEERFSLTASRDSTALLAHF
jgi:hypothetical protein